MNTQMKKSSTNGLKAIFKNSKWAKEHGFSYLVDCEVMRFKNKMFIEIWREYNRFGNNELGGWFCGVVTEPVSDLPKYVFPKHPYNVGWGVETKKQAKKICMDIFKQRLGSVCAPWGRNG